MRRRIFIAINLPENIKNKLAEYQSAWPELPARWIKKDNLHVTLVFLGHLIDDELLKVFNAVKDVSLKAEPFRIVLDRICYAPLNKKPPRMIWAIGENLELAELQRGLEKSLLFFENEKTEGADKHRAHTTHITLARIEQWEFRRIDPEEIPVVDSDISISFEVNSIEVMESQLKRGGSKYFVLESFPLSNI